MARVLAGVWVNNRYLILRIMYIMLNRVYRWTTLFRRVPVLALPCLSRYASLSRVPTRETRIICDLPPVFVGIPETATYPRQKAYAFFRQRCGGRNRRIHHSLDVNHSIHPRLAAGRGAPV